MQHILLKDTSGDSAQDRSDRNEKVLEGTLPSLLDLIAWSRCVGELGAVSAVGEPAHAENMKFSEEQKLGQNEIGCQEAQIRCCKFHHDEK